MALRVLIVGASGATGKHVVKYLLEQDQSATIIVRNKQAALESLQQLQDATPESAYLTSSLTSGRLQIIEASLLDMTDADIEQHVKETDVVISCLGHEMSLKSFYGHARRLCTDAARRLTQAIVKTSTTDKPRKFIMMNSASVIHATDPIRSWSDRTLLALLRWTIPPVADNQEAADYLFENLKPNSSTSRLVEWSVVRPTNLVDTSSVPYQIFAHPAEPVFANEQVSRQNVAKFIVDLATKESVWEEYKYDMPVIHDEKPAADNTAETDAAKEEATEEADKVTDVPLTDPVEDKKDL
jgi:nucleoside-diphosphate-sugar epimerase